MKKHLLGFALLSSMVLAGCQTNETTASETSSLSSSELLTENASSSTASTDETSSDAADSSSVPEEPKREVAAYTYKVNPKTSVIEPIDNEEKQVAVLTIDDAPDKYAVEMATQLKEKGISAIFFVNGMYIESEAGKEQLKQIHEMGFEIGNHTYTHANLKTIDAEKQREEILKTNDIIFETIGVKPRFFRAPHGINTDVSREVVEEEGMVAMNWTYGYDWEADYQDATALADIMVNTEYLNNGANLLMHDRSWTNEAILTIAEGLQSKGYTLLDPALIESPEREEENE